MGTPGSGVTGPIALPPGFSSGTIATGITGATGLAVAPDGRIFVCEQTGTLRVINHGALLREPLLTLDVDSSWERGLIGVTLDPDFAHNGQIYVCYVTPRPYVHHRVSRFTACGDVAVRGSEHVLLEGDDQAKLGGNVPAGHQGGALHFGRDGKLYVALGDQTAGAPAQRLTTFQGKLLRINPDGSIPADNPFVQAARGKYRAIWALGLRNPFRFAVQAGTGRIFINDVGQDKWEEIDEGAPGGNYGWPASEGPTTDARFRAPIYHYPVASITGGAFCPSGPATGFPPRYRGRYFFMDFVKGWIKVLDPDHPEAVETFAEGLMRPVRPGLRPRRGALHPAARRLGRRRQLPPRNRLAPEDRHRTVARRVVKVNPPVGCSVSTSRSRHERYGAHRAPYKESNHDLANPVEPRKAVRRLVPCPRADDEG